MKRFASLTALILVLVSFDAAEAQITFNYVIRDTGCELLPQTGYPTTWGDGMDGPGPYTGDLDVEQGAHQLRSVHDSVVLSDETGLAVSGSYLGSLSTTDPASIHYLLATANLMVSFTPQEAATVSLEVTIPAGSEVYFFDLTVPDPGFDHEGPGTFTLTDGLIPGHEYLFQVFYSLVMDSDDTSPAEAGATFAMSVVPDSVDFEDLAWGSIKSLYR